MSSTLDVLLEQNLGLLRVKLSVLVSLQCNNESNKYQGNPETIFEFRDMMTRHDPLSTIKLSETQV